MSHTMQNVLKLSKNGIIKVEVIEEVWSHVSSDIDGSLW